MSILLSILPVFLYIAFGYFLKTVNVFKKDFWDKLDKVIYYFLFPSLLVYKLSTADFSNIESFSFIFVAIFTLIFISIVLIVLDKFMFFFTEEAFTSIYQGSIRFNTYIFLAVISGVYADDGMLLAALLIAFLIPVINLFCISIFSIYIKDSKFSFYKLIKNIITNPLILACIIGGFINYFGFSLGEFVLSILEYISYIALPLGLLSVGAGLYISYIKDVKIELFLSLFVKLAMLPVMMFFMAINFDLTWLQIQVLVLFAAMPTAPSAYILAKQLKGDEKLMSATISIQTLVSTVTILVFISLLS